MLSGITATALSRYQEATRQIEESMQRLASGKPELSSHDEVRVSRTNNRISSLKAANSIVKQNQDLLESALAGTNSVESIVVKMREVAYEAQDDQLTSVARAALVDEYNNLASEIDWTALNTEYDGTSLLDGTFGTREVTIGGPKEDQNVDISLGDLTLEGLGIGTHDVVLDANHSLVGADNGNGGIWSVGDTVTIASSNVDSEGAAEDAIVRLDAALATLETERSSTTAEIERFNFTISHLTTMVELNEESVSTLTDLDEVAEMANLAQLQIQQQTTMALMAQAQQLSGSILQLLGG